MQLFFTKRHNVSLSVFITNLNITTYYHQGEVITIFKFTMDAVNVIVLEVILFSSILEKCFSGS